MIDIVSYAQPHRMQVQNLWRTAFGYDTAHNEPGLVIDKKLALADGLFFVALHEGAVAGTVVAGYDGHRGWLYSVAVHPSHRQQGIGTALVMHAEAELVRRGCMKINLQLADGNEAVARFYEALGYRVEPRTSMGKTFPVNIPGKIAAREANPA